MSNLLISGVQSMDTYNLCSEDVNRIFEIEKDMWAREDGLGEYIKCNSCDYIASKEDVYGYLPNDLKNETVSSIEDILGVNNVTCPKCESSNTSFLFGESYMEDIIDRFKNSESYLSVFRDNNGVIRGFVDGYIDRFGKIYKREFEKYYKLIGEDKISQLIEETITSPLPNELFYCSAIGVETKYKNFKIIVKLLQDFFSSINDDGRKIIGVSELKIGSSIHRLNSLFGAKGIGIKKLYLGGNIQNHNIDVNSDIFVNVNLVDNYRKSLSVPVRDLVSKIKGYIN